MELSMRRHWMENRWFSHIPTHYIIDKWGEIRQVNPDESIVWAVAKDKYNNPEMVIDANRNWIHIELVGNFNDHPPTVKQYQALQKLAKELLWKYEWMQIAYHQDFQSKNDPWVLFDREFMKFEFQEFELSRYYSPEKGQSKYFSAIPNYFVETYTTLFAKYSSGYEQDVCMNCGCLLTWEEKKLYDCTTPANMETLRQDQAWRVVACPPQRKFGTEFHIDWIGSLTCIDRGWAIQGNRLDLWMGYWMRAIEARDRFGPLGSRVWYTKSM